MVEPEKTPEEMLREMFGELDVERSSLRDLPNTTPLFRLGEAMPKFADELSQSLTEQGETALAASVSDLWVFDRCRCEADFCATIYTRPPPQGPFKDPGGLTVMSKNGPVYIDLSEGMIACLEVLDQPEIRTTLVHWLP